MINMTEQPQARGPNPTLSEALKGAHKEALARIEKDKAKAEVIEKTLAIIEALPSVDREFVDTCLSKVYS